MALINFPTSPSLNDEYTFEGRTWLWNGSGWEIKSFVAPPGATGATGPAGAVGATGATGVVGVSGATGATGPAGVTGPTGVQGPVGVTGATGPQGVIGVSGATGATGIQGPVGATGVTGPAGVTGPTGPQGVIGVSGATGATGIQGPVGVSGATGATGVQGPVGSTGPTGVQGPVGVTGATGVQGVVGVSGATGATGPAGVTGATGVQGPSGPTGATGPIGVTGATGATPAVGGSDTQVLFNDGGAIGGDAGLVYNKTTNKLTLDGDAQVTSINAGPLAGFRSAIVNGSFDHWQRATSQTANGYGSVDRWTVSSTGSTFSASRQSFTLGQTDVPGEPTYFFRNAVTSVAGAANLAVMAQAIEGVRTFAGQQVTVSFWAKADGAKPISVELSQRFGTGGSPSANVDGLGVKKVTLSTSWQKITATTTLPSIAGKTLGSDGNNALYLFIWFDAGSNFNSRTDTLGQQSGTFDIAQVQVEAGPVATPFERRPIGVELALCQRYFCLFNAAAGAAYPTAAGAVARAAFFFPVAMRIAPTITAGSLTINTNLASDSFSPASPTAVGGIYEVVQGGSAGNFSGYRTSNSASAEL